MPRPKQMKKKPKVAEVDISLPTGYVVGDLLWSKVPGHPFWPCMVTYDPLQGIFKKVLCSGEQVYHVQYFGKNPEHGWTRPNSILEYKGEKHLADYVSELSAKLKFEKTSCNVRNKELAKFCISVSKARSRRFAIEEADAALAMTTNSRLECLVFKYYEPSSNKKAKSAIQGEPAPVNESMQSTDSDVCNADQSSTGSVTPKEKKKKKIDKLCTICEKIDGDILCTGPCMQWFHMDCLGLISASENFMCHECMDGQHTCFSCKSKVGETEKCNKAGCGKFYHVACVMKYRVVTKKKFICPLHYCHTCFSENPSKIQNSSSKNVCCIRCPVAYHQREYCLGAGSVSISKSSVICPEHIEIKRNDKASKVISITWCSICGQYKSRDDELNLNCVTCPILFHKKCLTHQVPENEEKFFRCEDCLFHKHFRYGILVWVRVGAFKWWPAQILLRKEVPDFLLKLPHGVGQFPVKFFGTGEYYWAHRGNSIEYCEEDKQLAIQLVKLAKKNMSGFRKKKYIDGLLKSIQGFDKIAAARKLRAMKERDFKFIKTNRRFNSVKLVAGQPPSQCNCDPNSEFPCDYGTGCLNRSTLFECHPNMCAAKEKCCNQKFVKRQYPRLIEFETADRGNGLKTLEDLKKGQFIIEYVGDVIDENEFCKRLDDKHEVKDQDYYFLKVDKDRYIDAGPCGNMSRYMNHSCSPNCETQKWSVNGELRIGFFAIKDIPADTELTFDYSWSPLNNNDLKCLCGSENCRGFIGEKQHKSTQINDKKIKSDDKGQKRKNEDKKIFSVKKKRLNEIFEKTVIRKKHSIKTRIKSRLSRKKEKIESRAKSVAIMEEDLVMKEGADQEVRGCIVTEGNADHKVSSNTNTEKDANHEFTECVTSNVDGSNKSSFIDTWQKKQNLPRAKKVISEAPPKAMSEVISGGFEKMQMENSKADWIEQSKKVLLSEACKSDAIDQPCRKLYNYHCLEKFEYERIEHPVDVNVHCFTESEALKRLKGYICFKDRAGVCYLCKKSIVGEKEDDIFRCEKKICRRSFHKVCLGSEFVPLKETPLRQCSSHLCSYCDDYGITNCALCNFSVCRHHRNEAAFICRGARFVCEFHNLSEVAPGSMGKHSNKDTLNWEPSKVAKYRPAKAGLLVDCR